MINFHKFNFQNPLRHLVLFLMALSLSACASSAPMPSDKSFLMSVSTKDVTVRTAINGRHAQALSNDSNTRISTMPVNDYLKPGNNFLRFQITPIGNFQEPDPFFVTRLEMAFESDIGTSNPNPPLAFFTRSLSEEEIATLKSGRAITITERFTLK